ncbi:hypothetical protein Emed_003582 [Eimeria media]
MRLATLQALSALGALAVTEAIPLRRSFLHLSAQEESTSMSLQDMLDDKCRVFGEEACTVKKLTHYCGVKMYARKDIGTASQKNKVWRCYADFALSMDASGENCVDDCGEMKSCMGAVVGASSAHLTNTAALEAVIKSNKKTNCEAEEPVVEDVTVEEPEDVAAEEPSSPVSDLQKILDDKCRVMGEDACNKNTAGYCGVKMYARKDIGTASQKNKVWRCYTETSLQMDVSGENCVDDCGNMVSCLGAVVGSSKHHMTSTALDNLIASNKKTNCGNEEPVIEDVVADVAPQEPVAPQQPVAPEEPSSSTPTPTSLQDMLDDKCRVFGEEACTVKKLTHYCGVKMYARKDIGTASQKNKVWRCYADFALHMDVSGENCVDDCGNMKSCMGAVVGASSAHLTNTAALEAVIKSNKKTNCSTEQEVTDMNAPETRDIKIPETGKLQKVLDSRCLAKFAKMCSQNDAYCVYGVARKSGTWKCYPHNQLTSTGMSSTCVDDCGDATYCAGELPSNGANVIDASDLQDVVKELKAGFCLMRVGPSNSAFKGCMLVAPHQV